MIFTNWEKHEIEQHLDVYILLLRECFGLLF